jgi:diguanylate cyclase (GGDEF)-like protein
LPKDQIFSFETKPEKQVMAFDIENVPPKQAQPLVDMSKALIAAGEAAYSWTIEDDVLCWSGNTEEVLGCNPDKLESGKKYAAFLDVENLTSRYETVMRTQSRDLGDGAPFRIEYCFKSDGRNNEKSVWVEDQGRWYAGADGRPASVFGTVRRIDERYMRDQHLNFIGNCDPLTGMMNRGRMTEALGEAISVATNEQNTCAFAIASVNNLSVVNDAYGFEVADEVIVAMGQRLRQVLRSGDGIARYSGGKFGIILNNCSEQELQTALERFLAVARDSVIETAHGPVWGMLSIGAICLPGQVDNANMATARAEEALNEARRQPTDTFIVYKASERRTEERKLNARCATEIVHCLKTDRFKLAFQPLVCAKTGEVALHEALLRMKDGDQGELIAAGHLVPVSERLGLVRLIDRAVTQMIINTLHSFPDAKLAMNVSATTATDPRWYNQLLEMISGNAEIADRLTVEITETVALSDLAATRNYVERLRNIGCSVAIDDFGAGYTSFRNLRDLPVNMIKLDGQFCQNIKGNNDNEYIIRSLIDLAGKFNLKTVAEWVENEEDSDVLKSWGIDYLQGNFFGEATIFPPWQASSQPGFIITPPHTVIMHELASPPQTEVIAEIESPQVEVPEKFQDLVAETISELAEETVAILDQNNDVEVQELDFSDIDDSIFALKSTLDLLRQHFPPAEQIEKVGEAA